MSNYRANKSRGKSQKIKKMRRAQQRSSILKNRILWDLVLGVVLVVSLSHLLFFSRAFEIRDVAIAAPGTLSHLVLQVNKSMKDSLDKPFLWFLNKKSFFSVRAKRIKKEILNDYPEIDAMIIKREFPHRLFVELYERDPSAVWCYDETDCYFIDKQGIIFKPSTITATSTDVLSVWEQANNIQELPLIYTQNKINTEDLFVELLSEAIPSEKLSQIIRINQVFNNDLSIEVSHFITDSEEMLHVVMKGGCKVYFVLGSDIEMTITKLKLLFEKEISQEKVKNLKYIDLRFSKVYYK